MQGRVWIIGGMVALFAGLGMCVGFVRMTRPIPELSQGVVEVRRGAGLGEITRVFFGSNRFDGGCFKVTALLSGRSRRLKAGEYELKNDSIRSLLGKLSAGDVLQYRVTVAEGTWARDIAALLAGSGLGRPERFLELIHDADFIRRAVGYDAGSLEGYLFPETYYFTKGMKEEEVLGAFVARFRETVRALMPGADARRVHETVILASIVEREARAADERPLIAAVFRNRMDKQMRLESCVTVEYAMGQKKKILTEDDLLVASPYNTYRHAGLPPGAVSNPGRASIEAVISPADTDVLFFVAKGDGRHIFSKTWDRHRHAKKDIQRKRVGAKR